ncbi:MAG: hypothetical protein JSR81_02820 [Proteobacteria bacterium]|jgi:hypothetical protein|nr:hypothetical protein [Pseudomonadota bacterium]
MAEIEPDRLPPPPFWRTRYFENSVMKRADRWMITSGMVISVMTAPVLKQQEDNGRIRHWGYIPELGRWLRVVTLEDGETIHNVFLDRNFKP